MDGLVVLGNHTIPFGDKPYDEICAEVKAKLDTYDLRRLIDECYINPAKLDTCSFEINPDETFGDDKKNCEAGRIFLDGPRDLRITITKKFIIFDIHDYYDSWCVWENEYRNIWRKYFHQILKLFGGNEVIYFSDGNSWMEGIIYDKKEEVFEDISDEDWEAFDFEDAKDFLIYHYNEEAITTLDELTEESEDRWVAYYIDTFEDFNNPEKFAEKERQKKEELERRRQLNGLDEEDYDEDEEEEKTDIEE